MVVRRKGSGPRIPTFEDAIEILKLLKEGWFQHEVAAKLGFNQGRVSEVNTGQRHPLAREMLKNAA
jgi:transcriptional regulator